LRKAGAFLNLSCPALGIEDIKKASEKEEK
jgi:hypothetical protein